MSEMQAEQRSAVVFGARNLGRAIIELLVGDGWAVTGAARTHHGAADPCNGSYLFTHDCSPINILYTAARSEPSNRWRRVSSVLS